MIIDSGDDEPSKTAQTVDDKVEFEDEEEELDLSIPWPRVVQHVNIPLGAAAVDVCVPHMHSTLRGESDMPSILHDRIVVAVACSDSTARLLSLPLPPFSESMKAAASQPGYSGIVQEAKLEAGPKGHHNIPNKVSFTWTPRESSEVDYEVADDEGGLRRSRQGHRKPDWDFLLASSSADVAGLLLIGRIPVDERKKSIQPDSIHDIQRVYLSSPAVDVAFNSASFPSKRHAQLLVADQKGVLRIYNPLGAANARQRVRRGSDASSLSIRQQSSQGSWIASFSTPFHSSTQSSDIASPSLSTRKSILAAKWVCQGRGVLTLMADGEYGVWDFDGAAPSQARSASIGSFGFRGFVGSSSRPSSSDGFSSADKKSRSSRSSLAPMTPKTRKEREEKLFSSSSPSTSAAASAARGGLAVSPRQPSSSSEAADESVVMWYAGEAYIIANFRAFWKRSAENRDAWNGIGTGSLFGPGIARIEGLDTQGELISAVDQFIDGSQSAMSSQQPDLLISAESRLLILSKQVPGLDFGLRPTSSDGALIRVEDEDEDEDMEDDYPGESDRQLLTSGELGIDGMNRMLDSMSGSRFGPAPGRRVGFAAS